MLHFFVSVKNQQYVNNYLTAQVEEEGHGSTSEEESSGSGEDEDEGPWMEPSHTGGNLPGVIRRRLVPTASFRIYRTAINHACRVDGVHE